jgi:glycosyltransferase involved in cell wall biosynthesis
VTTLLHGFGRAASEGGTAPANAVPILLTVRELNCGGIERDVTKIALNVDWSRFQPHVATYHVEGMRFEELSRAGVPILHLPVSSLKSPTDFDAAIRMRRYIREHNIRLVHSWDTSAAFAVPLARALRVPVVLSSILGNRDLLDQRSLRQVRWTDRMVDIVVVNCEAMRRHMIDDEQFPGERIELCNNGVDTDQFYPAPGSKPAPVADASFLIGTVCVLRPEKAVDLLQEAFARIRHLKPGMKLLIVGSGSEFSRLQSNSRRLGIQNDCVFVPATPNVAEYLHALDIFVLCSRSEAFSNALLEAMACGCCAVGSRVGGTPELIGNDERGLLFRLGDAGDLAAKLTTLIGNESLRSDFGMRSAEFARTRFSIEIASTRMAEIYETMLRRKAAYDLDAVTHTRNFMKVAH